MINMRMLTRATVTNRLLGKTRKPFLYPQEGMGEYHSSVKYDILFFEDKLGYNRE